MQPSTQRVRLVQAKQFGWSEVQHIVKISKETVQFWWVHLNGMAAMKAITNSR